MRPGQGWSGGFAVGGRFQGAALQERPDIDIRARGLELGREQVEERHRLGRGGQRLVPAALACGHLGALTCGHPAALTCGHPGAGEQLRVGAGLAIPHRSQDGDHGLLDLCVGFHITYCASS